MNNNNRYEFLRGFNGCYDSAYPFLVKHLNIKHHPRIREGIIRSLTDKDANKVASKELINQLEQETDPNLRWVLANALRTVLTRAQKRKYPEYKKIYDAKGMP